MTAPKLDLAAFEGHTPGPWQIGQHDPQGGDTRYNANIVFPAAADLTAGGIAQIYGMPINTDLESVRSSGRFREGLANARLIAAAPALLSECRRLQAELDGMSSSRDANMTEAARDSIAVARLQAENERLRGALHGSMFYVPVSTKARDRANAALDAAHAASAGRGEA